MNTSAAAIEILFEKAVDYSKTTAELYKLKALERYADIVSSLAARLVISVVAVMFVFSMNIAIALWIGEVLGKSYYGFLIIAGFYVLIVILLYIFRDRWIRRPVNNAITEKILHQNRA